MKRLYILRHAKSSWAQPGTGDIDRCLNDRGLEQIKLLNDWLSNSQQPIDHVICSPSRRTQETLAGLRSNFTNSSISIIDSLYLGELDSYLSTLGEQRADHILLIGHNPTCDELARYLASPKSPAAKKLMAHHFSTGTVAVLDFDKEHWSELSQASCKLVELVRPKELEQV
ncbi:MAG: histidine phosphatase family protein [Rhizobiaceae bacterium]